MNLPVNSNVVPKSRPRFATRAMMSGRNVPCRQTSSVDATVSYM
jgi:hypothetical protein